jgi:hypothetical protein
MDSSKYPENAIPCLDKGFIRLIDFMGGDEAIVQAARVSYGKGTKMVSQDRGLIRYLMRHRHTTPFEMVEFKFHCKMPICVIEPQISMNTALDIRKHQMNFIYLNLTRSIIKAAVTGRVALEKMSLRS